MKIIHLLPVLAFVGSSLSVSNRAEAQTAVGITIGPDFSNANDKVGGSKSSTNMIVRVSGGIYADFHLVKKFYIQPSLMYEGKGFDDTYEGVKSEARYNYLTLPLNILLKPEMQNGNKWIVGAGPYFGYGFSGKSTGTSSTGTVTYEPFKARGGINRFDFGAGFQLGYEIVTGFNFGLNGEFGLIDLLKQGDEDNSARQISFSIRLGYSLK